MIRVAIVEDETLVRLGLRMSIEESPVIRVTGAYASAEEAKEGVAGEPPDILLTDIRLPGESGLSLMKELREKYPKMQFVVVSCYEDFSYAREAMECGAGRYILKHELNEHELPDILISLKKEAGSGELENMRNYIHDDAKRILESGSCLRCAFFVFRGENELYRATEEDISMELVGGMVRNMLEKYDIGSCFIRHGCELVGMIAGDGGLAALKKHFGEISGNLSLYMGKNCYIGVSRSVSNEAALQESMEEAREAAAESFFYEKSRIFEAPAEITEKHAGENRRISFSREDAFSAVWLRKMRKEIREYFAYCGEKHPSPERIKEEVMRFLQEAIAYGEKWYGLDRAESYIGEEPSYRMISRMESLRSMEQWLVRMVELTAKGAKGQDELQQIREYLEENYMRDLPQAAVAERFGMSASYFSQYFKHKFNMNYVQYVNYLRIEKAKLMLRTSGASTETISDAVGIPNVNYFFRLFKKMEKITVRQYRARYHKKVNET
ncbi:response regulator transcription factor [Lachnoclostridium sp. Marseille-P6806]|uniref:response regulator transcription factor n=1 Tax=Lachnoclostridium sp. Marseille-P6806 TaxID=2364793 RepID=UPI00103144D4|nr:response regulator [Lachnoclostridium sp. Marseille-P6806]